MTRRSSFNSMDVILSREIKSEYDNVKLVADQIQQVATVADNLEAIAINSNNKENITKVAKDIESINYVTDSVIPIMNNMNTITTVGSNIGKVTAVADNYDEIKAANEQASFGLLNAINVTANTIGIDSIIGPNQNAVSFGPMVINNATITINDNSQWSIIY